jgi:mannose-6-phosphate isomerase-like protein (cupin superfamily)
MSHRILVRWLSIWIALGIASAGFAQSTQPAFLRRSLSDVKEKPDDLTADKVHYRPLFGMGDADASLMKGVTRYGEVTLDPGGSSKTVAYDREEQAYFVISGAGTLLYGDEKQPIKANDFIYLPPTVKHGLSNSGTQPLRVMVMGYVIPQGREIPAPAKLMIASTDDVPLQILGQHGPTTQFKLLIGPTTSTRDKLAASRQINDLFEMDFAPGGTNIPHNHPNEEEIYFVLRGSGDMAAGGTTDQPTRHACKEGDAFYFAPGTVVGYFSNAREGQPHDLILAVRAPLPNAPARGGRAARGPASQPAISGSNR